MRISSRLWLTSQSKIKNEENHKAVEILEKSRSLHHSSTESRIALKLASFGFHGELVEYLGKEVRLKVKVVSKSFFCFLTRFKG
ncbi:hypothetical protein [cyanobacterium endosymbiont of Rhopalodia gibberula]|uniref:hypothetical protein n=1 Tax=cyanobacterium endosymbiont of Rhopalodia gibberula TaxID=1763363 RepID=UPI001E54B002|nr:hypothetical protein [cyanobacterium endosymbiont of Rhopalodia gibberula]